MARSCIYASLCIFRVCSIGALRTELPPTAHLPDQKLLGQAADTVRIVQPKTVLHDWEPLSLGHQQRVKEMTVIKWRYIT